MFAQAGPGTQASSIEGDVGGSTAGKRTLTGERDARGGGPAGHADVDDRTTGALIGGGIGAIGGAIVGGLVGGVPGAIGGAVAGGAIGAGIGALVGGGGGGGTGTTVPTPVAVRNGPNHAPIDAGDQIGMSIAITVTSSTGVDADMARIQDSERVGTSINHTGSAVAMPPSRSNNSDFMPGHPIPDDQHGSSRTRIIDLADNHGGNGSYEREQLDVYTDAAAGVTAPTVIPNSGYIVKRIITKGPGTRVMFRVEKRPAGVTVNGFTTAAGPSAMQADDVVARA